MAISRSKQRGDQRRKEKTIESLQDAAKRRKPDREELAHFLHGIGAPPKTEFVPDPFQLEAINLVTKEGCDVLVAAPTGSGKTWIATEAIKKVLETGCRAWYTSPLKALSNDKFREFSALFGPENVGILTGDRKVNPGAPLIVATTEIYRNSLYDAMNELEVMNARLVVFDEVHYLADRERGVVWEEAIIYSPAVMRVLMLSATVGNAQELSDWVSWARGSDCRLVFHPDRPVPMRTGFIDSSGRLYPLTIEGHKLHPEIRAIYAANQQEQDDRRRDRTFRRAFKYGRHRS
jgi:ATP-dependent RNA helicase HelY